MIAFLRFTGIVNAAIWFGAAVLFTFFIGPAAFSNEMLNLFGGPAAPVSRGYAGAIAQILLERYYLLQYWCAGIALGNLLIEWLYTARPVQRLLLYVVLGLTGLTLLNGIVLQPQLKRLHYTRYGATAKPAEREAAARTFALWHGVAQVANLLVTLGLLGYTWRVINPPNQPRFIPTAKFRS